ncbi:MAG TPA: DUF4199 domain-containing protein [Candidatus Lachnoclostridium stercoravium]|uniref:DUF4199 domain-containing protein n=1 Tax=Candidatus Lachnoclostridium stercoravium TaxID=2838633 RepID=A0A9D2HLC3_9FIRM|nr:DUF4199 domain-containing protein [Candidatus Lachnoclostridium stercoravium]
MDENNLMELAVRLENVDVRSRSNGHRIDSLEADRKEAQEMRMTLIRLTDGIDTIESQLAGVKEDILELKKGQAELADKVATLENRPAVQIKETWDSVGRQLLLLFASGLFGFLLSLILPAVF